MDSIKQYLLSVVLAVIIIGIAKGMIGKKSPHKDVISLMSGLILLLTILIPLKSINWYPYSDYFDEINLDAEYEVILGQQQAQSEMEKIITEQTESYIFDKATAMGADLDVSVEIETVNSLPMPVAVKLEGSISPYAKTKMKEIIKNDIGIPEDRQEWK